MSPSSSPRQIGLAHLSLIATPPPDLVEFASQAGFDFVGLRVQPATATERRYDFGPGSALLQQTLQRLVGTGVRAFDIEFLLLDGSDQRQIWLRMLKTGQALGASAMTVGGADPEPSRFIDNLARMAEDGRDFGIVPVLEPMSYQHTASVPAAARAAREAGTGIVIDALHLRRSGGTASELREAADVIRLLQISDAPVERPADRDGLVEESRSRRLPPGEGDLDIPEILAALPETIPVSLEVPSPSSVSEVGPAAWAARLREAAGVVFGSSTPSNRA